MVIENGRRLFLVFILSRIIYISPSLSLLCALCKYKRVFDTRSIVGDKMDHADISQPTSFSDNAKKKKISNDLAEPIHLPLYPPYSLPSVSFFQALPSDIFSLSFSTSVSFPF